MNSEKSDVLVELSNALKTVADILMKLSGLTREVKAVADSVAEAVNTPSFEEVRTLLAGKSRDGHTKEVKALLSKYGVEKLSALPKEQYKAIMNDAEAIDSGNK